MTIPITIFILTGSVTILVSLAIFIYMAYKSKPHEMNGSVIVHISQCVDNSIQGEQPVYFCSEVLSEDGATVSDFFKGDPQSYVGKPGTVRVTVGYQIFEWIAVLLLLIAGICQLAFGIYKARRSTV